MSQKPLVKYEQLLNQEWVTRVYCHICGRKFKEYAGRVPIYYIREAKELFCDECKPRQLPV